MEPMESAVPPSSLLDEKDKKQTPLPYRIFSLLIFLLLTTYLVIGMSAGSTMGGAGSLKERMHCCSALHVTLGFWAWYFPPLLPVLLTYQIMDHYGLNGRGTEPWEQSVNDMIEYSLGFCMCWTARRVRPIDTWRPRVLLKRVRELVWEPRYRD